MTLYERTLCANLCEMTPPSIGRRVKVLWGSVSPRIWDLPLKMCLLGLGLGTGSVASSSCWRTSCSGSHLWIQGLGFRIQGLGFSIVLEDELLGVPPLGFGGFKV
jgi:hypothetical protein